MHFLSLSTRGSAPAILAGKTLKKIFWERNSSRIQWVPDGSPENKVGYVKSMWMFVY